MSDRSLYEVRKVTPGADYWTRSTQPVVERFIIGTQEAFDYANLLTNETGIRHVAWAAGHLDANGQAVIF